MKYVCCYLHKPHPRTKNALDALVGERVHYHAIAPGDPFGYGMQLADYWRKGEGFAVVEHDIVIRQDVVTAFDSCERPYCAFPYAWTTNVGPALGCTRFSSEFLNRYPNAMQELVDLRVGWQQLDVVLMRRVLAGRYGQQPHVHLPPVLHLNPLKELLPDADPTPLLSVPVRDLGNLQ